MGVLSQYWQPGYARYVEPFAGSACLFFKIRARDAVLGDLNDELIRAYEAIRDSPEEVARELGRLRPGESEYYAIRAQRPELLALTKRAARFLYLNRFCFNGLYRTNSKGVFNVPFGGSRSGSLPTREALVTYSEAIRHVDFRSGDFEDTIRDARSGDFVYLDPPFAVAAEWRRGLHYTDDAFAVDDVTRLQFALAQLDAVGAAFVCSYADSTEGHLLAVPYYCRTVSVRRSIAGSVFKRARQNELLISNRPHVGATHGA